jgi:hypothetical protein
LTVSVTLAGQVITGGTESLNVTVCVQVAVLPEASVAVHTMLWAPAPVKVAGTTGLLLMPGVPPQLSVAVAGGPV